MALDHATFALQDGRAGDKTAAMGKWLLVLALVMVGAGCEDDPTDLDYLKGGHDGGAKPGEPDAQAPDAPGADEDAG